MLDDLKKRYEKMLEYYEEHKETIAKEDPKRLARMEDTLKNIKEILDVAERMTASAEELKWYGTHDY